MRTRSTEVVAWLQQFSEADRATARKLVDCIHYISADEFRSGILALIRDMAAKTDGPLALYVERRVPGRHGVPFPLYKWSPGRVRRAEGVALRPADPERNDEPDIGSEGIIAQFVSMLQRQNRDKFRVHPSMQDLRQRRPRTFVLVTDFIGSGDQVTRFLDSAWKVPTITSWASYGIFSFEVVAYSGTDAGIEAVRKHPSKPKVTIVMGCPTIGLLPNPSRDQLIGLCEDYCPSPPTDRMTSLGYGDTGALIAFAHGTPNNVPLLLFRETRRWKSLFKARTIEVGPEAEKENEGLEDARLSLLREEQLKSVSGLRKLSPVARQTVLVLAALKRRPRNEASASARTGLTMAEVRLAIRRAKRAGLLTDKLRPTEEAYAEFKYLRKSKPKEIVISADNDSFYFPSMLRPPKSLFR
ncbi:hypothetical protein [Hyphomicrobium sp. ghe19]|uniref:phosphoribosyltransferase-like protein n=1 Tax=Hyphomicrobium sp. ghe19 TaxID=2682968 RepID=UPI001367388B|nr:hypothetical protein HYPP_03202 [Hyphomicrobium sp. ghe19]